MTPDEANAILNEFAGWKAGRKCVARHVEWFTRCPCGSWAEPEEVHDIPPIGYFADTPEAREAVRLLKDEFVRRTGYRIDVSTGLWADEGMDRNVCFQVGIKQEITDSPIESHAIAFAIAAALKEQRK